MSADDSDDNNIFKNGENSIFNNFYKSNESGLSNFEFRDPLFLHPNDTSLIPLINFKLTGTDNYNMENCATKFALRLKCKLGFIDGTCKRKSDDPVLTNRWDLCNSMVVTWILNSVSAELYVGQIYSKTAYDMWTDLKDTYDKVDGFAPPCTCEAAKHYENHANQIKLTQFLMGLDDTYQPIRSNILTTEPLPLVKTAFAIISGEEYFFNGSVKFNMDIEKYFNGKSNFISGNISIGWVVESGANQHMTTSAKILINVVDVSNLGRTVGHPNGTKAKIVKIRDLKLNNYITLFNVLVVPEYTVNLLSIDKLAKDKDNAHPEGNTERINQYDESEDESNHLLEEGIDLTNHIDYDDVAEPVRRTSRQTKLLLNLNDYVIDSKIKFGLNMVFNYSRLYGENLCITTTLNKSFEPSNYKETINDNNWVEAMNTEMEALHRNQTWEITNLPKGRKPIGCKWIFKIKYNFNGEIKRYKARLVAKGFSQREGIDYDETFSHVVKMSTIRCLIAVVVKINWPLFQLDVNNAFLYGELEEDVYMKIPEGYASESNEKVCSLNDHSLFVKSSKDSFIALLVYVDDIIISGNDLNEINAFKDFLSFKFQIKDLEKLKYFLGIEVLESDKAIYLSQRKYCIELLHEFGMLGCKPTSVPMEPNVVLNFKASDNDPTL
ncbi:ribonuclease H-like domain-containing protein [Tanacetum coccineum]